MGVEELGGGTNSIQHEDSQTQELQFLSLARAPLPLQELVI